MDVEEQLIKQLQRMLGYVPIGTRDLLHVLTHPDAIELTSEYIESIRNTDSVRGN